MSDGPWNVESLRETIFRELEELKKDVNRRFADQDKARDTAFVAAQTAIKQSADNAKEAVQKSEIGVEKRSDSVYVTLSKLQDALASLMPRAEAEQRFSAIIDRIEELKTSKDNTEGRSTQKDLTLGKIIAVIGVAVSIAGLVITLTVLGFNN